MLLYSNSLLCSNEYNVNICNKQPQMGCVNTSRERSSLLCLHQQMDGNDITNRTKTRKCKKYGKKTTLQNDLNYARVKMIPWRCKTFLIGACKNYVHEKLIERVSYDLEMKTREQNRNNKRTEIKRFDWFIERIQTHLAFGWLSERSAEKTSCPKNFLEIALTSHCNTTGQSNNAFSVLGFS